MSRRVWGLMVLVACGDNLHPAVDEPTVDGVIETDPLIEPGETPDAGVDAPPDAGCRDGHQHQQGLGHCGCHHNR